LLQGQSGQESDPSESRQMCDERWRPGHRVETPAHCFSDHGNGDLVRVPASSALTPDHPCFMCCAGGVDFGVASDMRRSYHVDRKGHFFCSDPSQVKEAMQSLQAETR
jgi:hypothetical protein